MNFMSVDDEVIKKLYDAGYKKVDEKIKAGWTWRV
jgi:hypothetical protein